MIFLRMIVLIILASPLAVPFLACWRLTEAVHYKVMQPMRLQQYSWPVVKTLRAAHIKLQGLLLPFED